MNPLIFGVWDGRFYDNRSTFSPVAPDDLPLEQFSQFNPGNPIMTFYGFLKRFSNNQDTHSARRAFTASFANCSLIVAPKRKS